MRSTQHILKPEGSAGISAGRIILYIVAILLIAMFLLNFLSSFGVGGCIGIIEINGQISTYKGYGLISSSEVISLLKEAEERPDIRGLVLVMNTPGGSAVASNEIYSYLKEMKKPTVTYISEMAASGGYFVSLGSDYIYSNPYAITGSIGARTGWVIDLSKWLNNTGINMTVIKSGEMKDTGEIYRPMTEEEIEVYQAIIDEIGGSFLNLTIKERSADSKFSNRSIELISDARLFTGRQAYEIGLVDALGIRQDAINKAAMMAGLDRDPNVCVLETKKDFFTTLFNEMGKGIGETLSSKLSFNSLKIQ
ncbi:MAG: signal peptide peptidase SppA [Candidatus Micrarchaeota archaeon]|nr:signal peptide peptidase SppA [Candidatus Micrarchaeota archaeon]